MVGVYAVCGISINHVLVLMSQGVKVAQGIKATITN